MIKTSSIVMDVVTDPVELAEASALRAQAERNYSWWQSHAKDMFSNPAHRGKCVCITQKSCQWISGSNQCSRCRAR